MTNAEEEEDLPLRPTKYPKFRVATGGKGPPDPPEGDGHDWLSEYTPGTSFVSMRINSKDCDFELFHVVFQSLPDVVLLKWQLPDGKIWDKYVNPAVFSKMFKPGVILGVIEPREEAEGDANGNGNRTDRSCDMVLHETVPGEHHSLEDPEGPEV